MVMKMDNSWLLPVMTEIVVPFIIGFLVAYIVTRAFLERL